MSGGTTTYNTELNICIWGLWFMSLEKLDWTRYKTFQRKFNMVTSKQEKLKSKLSAIKWMISSESWLIFGPIREIYYLVNLNRYESLRRVVMKSGISLLVTMSRKMSPALPRSLPSMNSLRYFLTRDTVTNSPVSSSLAPWWIHCQTWGLWLYL